MHLWLYLQVLLFGNPLCKIINYYNILAPINLDAKLAGITILMSNSSLLNYEVILRIMDLIAS
mgnify:CR=1 FL=1